ncbi:porin [Paraburkholderia sediminicola]|uniref:porin n=1 Tax=Paraburkholderia sediminicola TaxID=458836 RepID=UPI0038BAA1AE
MESRLNSARGLFAAGVLAASLPALGQNSVTLYGVVDAALSHQNGVSAPGGSTSKTLMTDGFMTGSRFGFKGVEDLGGGYQALFDLENGFNSFSGALAQQGQLFGRQAWVGVADRLSSGSQSVKFGRQYGSAFQVLSTYDSLYWGNQPTVVWPITFAGVRFDNSVEYGFQSDRVYVNVQYSVGGQTTGNVDGSTTAIGGRYDAEHWSTGADIQESRDSAGRRLRFGALGGSIHMANIDLHGIYMVSLRDPHFTVGASGSTTALANTNLMSNSTNATTRRDEVADVGVKVTFGPALFLLTGFAYDHAASASSLGAGGTVKTAYTVIDYFLSKRTDIYAEFDYTRLTGYEIVDPAAAPGTFGGTPSHTGFGVGLRTRF